MIKTEIWKENDILADNFLELKSEVKSPGKSK